MQWLNVNVKCIRVCNSGEFIAYKCFFSPKLRTVNLFAPAPVQCYKITDRNHKTKIKHVHINGKYTYVYSRTEHNPLVCITRNSALL